jgi:hypothetical protein
VHNYQGSDGKLQTFDPVQAVTASTSFHVTHRQIEQMQLWMHRTYECAAPGANIPVPSTNPPKKKTLFEAVAVMLQKDVDGGDAFVAGHICHILLPED